LEQAPFALVCKNFDFQSYALTGRSLLTQFTQGVALGYWLAGPSGRFYRTPIIKKRKKLLFLLLFCRDEAAFGPEPFVTL